MSQREVIPLTVDHSVSEMQDSGLFPDLAPFEGWEIKLEQIAADLCALMDQEGKTRAQMAEKLGGNKSVISKMLSGDNNTTVKKIWEFAETLGYDFDVVFHGYNDERPLQPWEKRHFVAQVKQPRITVTFPDHGQPVELQNAERIVADYIAGEEHFYYLAVGARPPKSSSVQASPRTLEATSPVTLNTLVVPDSHNLPTWIIE